MVMYPREREQRRDRKLIAMNLAIGNDEYRITCTHRIFGLRCKAREPRLDRFFSPRPTDT